MDNKQEKSNKKTKNVENSKKKKKSKQLPEKAYKRTNNAGTEKGKIQRTRNKEPQRPIKRAELQTSQ